MPKTRVANAITIEIARLVRLRKDDNAWIPSSVVVHLSGQRDGEPLSVFGQADLRKKGEHVLVSSQVWERAEAVLDALPELGETIDTTLSRFGEVVASTDEAFASRFRDKDWEVFGYFLIAFRKAFDSIYGTDTIGADEAGVGAVKVDADNVEEFFEKYESRISHFAVSPPPAEPMFEGQSANVFPDAPFIEPLPKDGTKGFLLEREALRYGMSSTRFPNGAFVVSNSEGKRLGFKWGRSPLASGVALSICSYKEATRRLLERVDVPVPQGRVFSVDDFDKAVQYADRIGYPVVVKPVAGLRGIGVVAGIQNRSELTAALDLYTQSEMGGDDFVLEEHVPGEDYRIVIIGDEVVASVVRAPASVVGDGKHTVMELIEYKNRARKENPHLSSRPIKLGETVKYQLSVAGLTYSSVPEAGQHVTLANGANLSQGGDSFEIASKLHPTIKELAVKAVKAVPGLGFCGLDMLIEDPTKSIHDQRVTVIELNAHAAIGSAQYPMWGTPFPVAQRFFEETAREAGIGLPEQRADTLSNKIRIKGKVTGVGYRRWFAKRAKAFGLTGTVRNLNDRTVEAFVEGPADGVAAIAYLSISGPEKAAVSSVTATPAEPRGLQGFTEVRPK